MSDLPSSRALANLSLRLAKLVCVTCPLISLLSLGPSPGALLTLTNVKGNGDMLPSFLDEVDSGKVTITSEEMKEDIDTEATHALRKCWTRTGAG